MRQVLVAVLALGFVSNLAAAQRADTTFVARPQPPARRVTGSAKRDAERRRRVVDYIQAKSLGELAEGLDRRRTIGRTLLLSNDLQTAFLVVRRRTSSQPEVHARWDDLVIVRSGTGAIEMGDSLVGSRYRAPGERAGGTFTASHQIVVHVGDIVRIPAAVPHAFVVSGTEPLEYLLVKQRRQELPIRWFSER
jgi:mannose-6-phosphate isomerase-like protein (cupin superfamily)